MKIAILGAKGFIGSYLCRHFAKTDHTVIPVTRNTVDLSNYWAVDKWLRETDPDVVVNCAISGGGAKVNDINYTDVQRDLQIFLNFYNSSHSFRYINVGSGAEFDRRTSITNVTEDELLGFCPVESYGFTKNTIARMVLNRDNFYTLRLFGCFDSSEPDIRLFKQLKQKSEVTIQNKYFDYISAKDFSTIVEYYCGEGIKFKDVNCVYNQKRLLSEQVDLFILYHGGKMINASSDGLHYTAYGGRLESLNLPLAGLEAGIKEYE